MECKKILLSLLILLFVITMAPRKCIFNLPIIVLFINLLTIWLGTCRGGHGYEGQR
jgi:hypothetical protein